MGQKISNGNIISNMIWRFAERCGAQGVAFIVSLVLARLLEPRAYGIIALITVFTSILNVFIDSGFGNALIQKKDADDIDFSSVFYFNITICSILYILMYLSAPYIAWFYNDEQLTPVIRVLSLTLVISGVKNVQQAYVSKTMQFKRFFFATLGGTLGAAILGIVLAYKGYGVWALVAQQLFNSTLDTIILWLTVKWKPKAVFSWQRLKALLSYGWKFLASSLINTIYQKIRSLIVGKHYSSADLAFLNKGDQFPALLINNINTSINSVLLPAMSNEQENSKRVKEMTRRAIKTSSYIIWPAMFGLAAIATPLIRMILTEKWLPCVFFLRINCFVYAFQPIQTANLNAIKAMGRSDLFLKLEIIKNVVGLTAMFATIFISIKVMSCSYVVTTVLSMIINSYPNKKLLGYSFKEQLKDIMPSICISAIMYILCILIKFTGLNDFLTIIIQVVLGAGFYIGVSALFKLESFLYLKEYVLVFKKTLLNRGEKNDTKNR